MGSRLHVLRQITLLTCQMTFCTCQTKLLPHCSHVRLHCILLMQLFSNTVWPAKYEQKSHCTLLPSRDAPTLEFCTQAVTVTCVGTTWLALHEKKARDLSKAWLSSSLLKELCAYMKSECLDGLCAHDIPFLSPFTAVLFCQLHKAGDTPIQVLGVEGRAHQLAHVEMVIECENCHRLVSQQHAYTQRPVLCKKQAFTVKVWCIASVWCRVRTLSPAHHGALSLGCLLHVGSKSMKLLDNLSCWVWLQCSHECRLDVITQRQWVAVACSAKYGQKNMAAENCPGCFARQHEPLCREALTEVHMIVLSCACCDGMPTMTHDLQIANDQLVTPGHCSVISKLWALGHSTHLLQWCARHSGSCAHMLHQQRTRCALPGSRFCE